MISIIVPVYNVEQYVEKCLDSILAQTYRDLEILVIDDGSTDRCGEICDTYAGKDRRIRVFHTENRGLSAARNLGLDHIHGQYVGFVDSDDWIEPDMYEILLKLLESNDTEISICGFWEENIRTTKWMAEATACSGIEALRALLDGKVNNQVWNKLFKRDVFEKTSFPEGKIYEDIVIMHRAFAEATNVVMDPMPLYHYRKRPLSISESRSAKDILDYAESCLTRYSFFYDEKKDLFLEKQEQVKLIAARGICMVWRWWFGCTQEEKRKYGQEIEDLLHFTKVNIPLFGYKSWPFYLKLSTIFMYSDSTVSFAVIYWMNQIYRRMSNIIRCL